MTAPAETPEPPGPLSRFRALWPITDPTTPLIDVLTDAVADLPAVARRHGARTVVHHAPPVIRSGRTVPGSGGAAHVVTIDAVIRLTHRTATRHGAAA